MLLRPHECSRLLSSCCKGPLGVRVLQPKLCPLFSEASLVVGLGSRSGVGWVGKQLSLVEVGRAGSLCGSTHLCVCVCVTVHTCTARCGACGCTVGLGHFRHPVADGLSGCTPFADGLLAADVFLCVLGSQYK